MCYELNRPVSITVIYRFSTLPSWGKPYATYTLVACHLPHPHHFFIQCRRGLKKSSKRGKWVCPLGALRPATDKNGNPSPLRGFVPLWLVVMVPALVNLHKFGPAWCSCVLKRVKFFGTGRTAALWGEKQLSFQIFSLDTPNAKRKKEKESGIGEFLA